MFIVVVVVVVVIIVLLCAVQIEQFAGLNRWSGNAADSRTIELIQSKDASIDDLYRLSQTYLTQDCGNSIHLFKDCDKCK